MKELPSIAQKEWRIPRTLTKESSEERFVDMLRSINKINDTNSYYIRDFYKRKIIIDSASSTILCGYPKEVAEREGFSFYRRILAEKEWDWIVSAYRDSSRIFHDYPQEKRKCLVTHYDFEVKTASHKRLILQHKATPYLLCEHGNLWLSLCSVSVSSQELSRNATIKNTETGEIYEFINGKFVLSKKLVISQKDIELLKLLCSGLSNEEILALSHISQRSLTRKKEQLLKKFKATRIEQAIHQAHLLGII